MPKVKRERVDLTADEITAWAESLSGMTVKEIAQKHNMSESGVYKWLERAKQTIGQHDVEEMRACLYSLFPEAITAIKHCLTKDNDGQIALRLLSGLTVLSDKRDDTVTLHVVQDERHKRLATGLQRFGYVAPVAMIEGGSIPGEGGEPRDDGTNSDDMMPPSPQSAPHPGNGSTIPEDSEPNESQELN